MPIQPWDDGPEEVVADERDEAEERWSQEENAYREEYRDRDRVRDNETIEQNAKLVTALSELRDYCLSERGGPYVSARRVNEICDTDALASVKGEQG